MEEKRRTYRRIECHLKDGNIIESWQPNECIGIEALSDLGYYNDSFLILNYTKGIDNIHPIVAVPISCVDYIVDTGNICSKAIKKENVENG